ncbi:hypothetical protein D8674_017950 [Pyrus ussuriensis x Pyrus communis]|uniref:DUF547 domain-containing protein n=1 Tax=Pyrus ussuriensis x Pyrus communis TaxID=2448454 RepID=A0A5N5HL80_9ROSA|nr:hypothetical protein D8674_017950 [Pyrus ussuriensis x Pyrus communis]
MKSATSDKINGLFSLFNPLLGRTSLDQASLCWDSYKALGSSSVNSIASLDRAFQLLLLPPLHQGLKEKSGPCATMTEVSKICLDDDNFNYAAKMLQNFRSLVRSLEKVDVLKMKREQKLVFWINIHNALVMHAYLAHGTHNRAKSSSILKAVYNIGGHSVNACIIQTSILGIRAHHSAPVCILFSDTLLNLIWSDCFRILNISWACSDPAVRAYTANSVFQDLKLAQTEFIQDSVKETEVFLPKILD